MLVLYSAGFLLYYSVGLRQTPLSGNITNCPALFFVRNTKDNINGILILIIMKINKLIGILLLSIVALVSCGPEQEEYYPDYDDNNGSSQTDIPAAPSNLRVDVNGYELHLSWNASYGATYYNVYYSSSYSGTYEYLGYCETTSAVLNANYAMTFYIKVTAVNNYGESSYSNIASGTVSDGGGNTGGGNTGGGNTGGGNNGGDSTTKPSAPTGVYAVNYGSTTYPDVQISWNSVYGATGYYVYRSTSASGSYTQLGSTSYTSYSDTSCKVGGTYYYKVKAYNSAGTSDYSDYCRFDFTDNRKPGPVTYGNCTVSGTQMTLRWTVPTDASYGKPTKALLRVKNPDSDEYVTLEELPGTQTSVTFTYTPWVSTSGYTEGYIYVGIILENENGTGGGSPKIYDNINKKWVN